VEFMPETPCLRLENALQAVFCARQAMHEEAMQDYAEKIETNSRKSDYLISRKTCLIDQSIVLATMQQRWGTVKKALRLGPCF